MLQLIGVEKKECWSVLIRSAMEKILPQSQLALFYSNILKMTRFNLFVL